MTRRRVGTFAPGASGNPKGRLRGQRNKATIAALTLLEGQADKLTQTAITKALEGDMAALRLCLERIAPVVKERPLQGFSIPKIENSKDALATLATVAERLAAGELLPTEAAAICGVLEQYRRLFETVELEERLLAIEEKLGEAD